MAERTAINNRGEQLLLRCNNVSIYSSLYQSKDIILVGRHL